MITADGRLVDPDLLEVEAIQTCINDLNVPGETDEFVTSFIREDRLLVISSGVAEFPDIPLHRVAK